MVNRMILQGRLTRDPELRQTQSGKDVVSFTLAWSEKYKDVETKLFLPCVAWGATATFVKQYFDKGAEMVAEGRLSTRSWQDNNGNNRQTTELTVERVHFAGAKKEAGESAENAPADNGFGFTETVDEDLPF